MTRATALLAAAAAAAAALLCAMLAGCGRQPPAPRNVLHIANTDEPRRLDPPFVKDLYEGIVSGFVYDGLVVFGKGTDVEPGLAGKWEVSSDGRTYTFHLRDARFSDGRAVTSADVRYSFTRVLQPATNSDRKWVLDRIDGAQDVIASRTLELRGLCTPDPRTVAITLRQPYPVFLTMLAMPTACIIPEGSAGHGKPDGSFDRAPIGTGPWMLASWRRDQRLEFRRNPHHWGRAPAFDQLFYHVIVDDNVRRRQFETGNHDIYQVGFSVYAAWRDDPAMRGRMMPVQELRTDYIGLMNSKPALADRRVRQAVTRAVDVQSIFNNLQKGRGRIAHGPVPSGIPGYRESQPPTHDVAAARKLLSSAGVKDLEMELWYRDEALNSEIAAAVRNDLAAVGVKVVPVPRDQAALRMGIWEGKPDLFLGSWTLDYPDMENALVPPFHSRYIPRQGNGSHFASAEVDALLDAAQHETSGALRIAKYQQAEDAIVRECPWLCLFHRATVYAVQPWVKGWAPAVMYNAERYADVTLDER